MISPTYAPAVGLSFLIIGLLLALYWLLASKLWPGCDEWKGYLLGSKDPLRGKDVIRWNTKIPQKTGQGFLLDISKKYGKGRKLSCITFMQGRDYALDYPIAWKVTLQNEHNECTELEGRESRIGEGITIEIKPPQKIIFIVIIIVEPRNGFVWAIENIKFKEVKIPHIWNPERLANEL